MKNAGLLSVLLGTLISCFSGSKKEVETDNRLPLLPYHLDIENLLDVNSSSIPLSEIGGELSYIPLETNSGCLLKKVHELDFFNETLLVSDFTNLYQFANQGRFIKKIGKIGSGPADYKYVLSILMNNDHTSFEMFTTGKVNVYDEQAEFSKTVRLDDPDIHPFGGARTSDDNSFLYLGSKFRVADDTTAIYSFVEIDSSGQIVRKIPNLSPIPSTYMGMIAGFTPLYRYENSIWYMDYGNDTLFTITSEGLITPYAVCRLGNKKRELNTADFNQQQMEALSSKLLVENIYENEANLFIELQWGGIAALIIWHLISRQINYIMWVRKGFKMILTVAYPFSQT
ncbi:MAG: 6-bladed beta-propeller [Tannerellaceae bacterium]|jgi:hypothetical protein|nr:6-bladed beta-propeller [Tannerellaceae bacterium]